MDFFRECPVSSPSESPTQHSREDDFSGLIFERMTDIEERSAGSASLGVLVLTSKRLATCRDTSDPRPSQ
jgi:hypothetical protein